MNETQTGIRGQGSPSGLCSAKRAAIKHSLPHRLTQSFPCLASAVLAFSDSLLHIQRHPIMFGQALSLQAGFLEPPLHRSDGPLRSPASHFPTCTHLHLCPLPMPTEERAPAPFASLHPQARVKLLGRGAALKSSICSASTPAPCSCSITMETQWWETGCLATQTPGWTTLLTPGTGTLEGVWCSQRCSPHEGAEARKGVMGEQSQPLGGD